MQFVNNWQQTIALPIATTSLALSLPDGDYRLVVSDALGTSATAWEVLDATVASGTADLTRGQEGTAAQEWPSGSVIYCTLTAGQVSDLFARVLSLESRVTALEQANIETREVVVTVGMDTFGSGYEAGWVLDGVSSDYGQLGGITPTSIDLPGFGDVAIWALRAERDNSANQYFKLALPLSSEDVLPIASLDVDGVGVLNLADASINDDTCSLGDFIWITWTVAGDDWALDSLRTVTFILT